MHIKIIFIFFLWTSLLFSQEVFLSSQKIGLGQPVKIKIKSDKKISRSTLKFNKKKFRLFLSSASSKEFIYESYFAASRYTLPGNYILTVNLFFDDESQYYQTYNIKLDYIQEKTGFVRLTKKSKKLKQNTQLKSKEIAIITKKLATITETKFFSKPFTIPAEGRKSSGFGKKRNYSGGGTSLHSGLDISNKIGTVVKTTQAGIVILSESFMYHGNTILIDHGYGVISIYCHLDERYVDEGEQVNIAQHIGTIGKTGVVSGAHLHWGISLQSVRTNPLYWVNGL